MGNLEERTIDSFEALFGGRVDAHVELRDGLESSDGLGKLSVRDQKRRDALGVKQRDERVDLRIHDRLADKRESAMSDLERLG